MEEACAEEQPPSKRSRSRISMACERCRKRRTRCDGKRPTCDACLGVASDCIWPEVDMRKQRKQGSSSAASTNGGNGFAHQAGLSPLDSHTSLSPALSAVRPLASPSQLLHPFPFQPARAAHIPFDFSQGHSHQPSNPPFLSPPANALGLTPMQQPQQQQFAAPEPHIAATQIATPADPLTLSYMRPQGKTGIWPGMEHWPLKIQPSGAVDQLHPVQASTSHANPSPQAGPSMSMAASPPRNGIGQSPSSTFSGPTSAALSDSMSVGTADTLVGEQQDASLLFEPGTNMPRSDLLHLLVKLFFEHMGASHFPFLSEQDLHACMRREAQPQEVLPGTEAFLLNAICAVSARFSDDPRLQSRHGKHTNGAPYWDRARDFVLPMLAIPCWSNVASLLLMSWYCFGANADSLLWGYSGMAMRMALDLGLHKEPLPATVVDWRASTRDRILFWACFHMEIYLTYGLGRTFTVKIDEVTVAEPTIEDLLRIHGSPQPQQTTNHALSPFPDYCKMTRLFARVADIVNDCSHRSRETQPPSRAEFAQAAFGMTQIAEARTLNSGTFESRSSDGRPTDNATPLMLMEAQMTHIMGSLDSSLRFSADSLRRHAENRTACMLLHLHLWYHSTLILLHRPPLIHAETSAARMSLSDRMEIVNHSAREIHGMVSLVEAISPSILWAGAFCNLPIYTAACACVQEYRIRTGRVISQSNVGNRTNSSSSGMQSILANSAVTSFTLLRNTLQLIAERWYGVNWVRSVLEKRGLDNQKLPLREMLDECYTFVTPEEMNAYRKLIQKATQAQEPPTLTDESISALFSSLAQPTGGGLDTLAPDDFASAYSLAALFPEMYYHAQRNETGGLFT